MKFTLLILLTCFGTVVLAQKLSNGKISGTVTDSLTHKPVEFANVTLIDPTSRKPINGTVCDANGNFSINKISGGSYQMIISFIGYGSRKINLTLSAKSPELTFQSLIISPSVKMLHEVVVEGQKMLIEEKVDRTIYNAEQDATTKGGDATDVLKRVPLLTVDADGNVSLKGSSSVRVLINNKPSTMTATSVADALKQIPSNMIKSVEVITSPSAKYDAEGSAGIINIVLKKNNLPGIFLTTDASAGNRGSNVGVNASYRQGKMGLSLGSFQRAQYNVISDFNNSQTTRNLQDTLTNVQSNHNRSDGMNSQYTLDWDYDINKNNAITATARYGLRNQNAFQENLLTNTYHFDTLKNTTLRNVKSVSSGYTFDGSLTYTKLFKRKDQELNFQGVYSRNTLTNGNGFLTTTIQPSDNSVINRYRNDNAGYNQEINLQLDYQQPLKENQLIEFGAKTVLRNVVSDYSYFISDGTNGPFVPAANESLSNNFNYNQDIAAGYLSYSFTTKTNYAVKAGGRYEYTMINAHFRDTQKLDIPSYGVFVPRINISRKLSNGRMLRVAYNRRIVRPWLQALNPNLQASNPLNATMGNPTLKPEYADNYEIAYKTNIPKGTLNMSLYSRYNTNDIQPARVLHQTTSDTIVSVYRNIGTEANFGTSIFASVNLSERLTLNGGADIFYRILKNNDPNLSATNQGLTQNFRIFGNYDFAKGWSVQLFTFFQGKQYNLQGYRTNVVSHSVGVKKEIFKKAGSFGMGLDNFMTPAFNIYSNLHSPYISQYTSTTFRNFIFKINFSYKIGRKLPEKEERKKLQEEEN
ncbi:MAG: TonB-dependent receptor [Bacteroidetes bacterium]|nr:TonB-dependent receptor [Bacteroidota bacterium]